MSDCVTCKSTNANFWCKDCKKSRYCSATCQTIDWKKQHRFICMKIVDIPVDKRKKLLKLIYGSLGPITDHSTILTAARYGLNDIIPILIARSVDVNYRRDNDEVTALMIASSNSNTTSSLETVQLLIANGADVNARDNDEVTALMIASSNSDTTSSLELLIANGADVNARDNDGYTALAMASASSHGTGSLETVQLLIDSGADVNSQDNVGNSVLMILAYSPTSSVETARLLIDNEANVNLRNNENMTALALSVVNSGDLNLISTIRLLLGNMDVNYIVESLTVGEILQGQKVLTRSFLHTVIETQNVPLNVFHLLFNYGANVNAKDSLGLTPLALAVSRVDDPHQLVHLMLLFDGDVGLLNRETLDHIPAHNHSVKIELAKAGIIRQELLDHDRQVFSVNVHLILEQKQAIMETFNPMLNVNPPFIQWVIGNNDSPSIYNMSLRFMTNKVMEVLPNSRRRKILLRDIKRTAELAHSITLPYLALYGINELRVFGTREDEQLGTGGTKRKLREILAHINSCISK